MGNSDFRSNKHLFHTLFDDLLKTKSMIQCLDTLTKTGLTYSQAKIFIKDICNIKISYEFNYEEPIKNYIFTYDKEIQEQLYNFTQYFYDNFSFEFKYNSMLFIDLITGEISELYNSSNSSQYYMVPVYGQISAGQPNWAEENIEGRLPIDTNLMNILNPEEYFFLRVNGESMNKIVKNGAFALIHKQDIVDDGEIAVVLVNGFDATLKKFTKQGDFVILEPQSDDESFKSQVYDKNTSIKILGKYVGKMEFNK